MIKKTEIIRDAELVDEVAGLALGGIEAEPFVSMVTRRQDLNRKLGFLLLSKPFLLTVCLSVNLLACL